MVNCKSCMWLSQYPVEGFMKGFYKCQKHGIIMKHEDYCSRWEDKRYWEKMRDLEEEAEELESED